MILSVLHKRLSPTWFLHWWIVLFKEARCLCKVFLMSLGTWQKPTPFGNSPIGSIDLKCIWEGHWRFSSPVCQNSSVLPFICMKQDQLQNLTNLRAGFFCAAVFNTNVLPWLMICMDMSLTYCDSVISGLLNI